jgi:uncharacterized glyoxalase superfamily protein PhnB
MSSTTDKTPAPAGRTERQQPESFRARGLGLSLTVRDLQKSVAWYRDVVGFTVDREIERDGVVRSVALKAGSAQILLNLDNGAKGFDRVKGEGFSFQLTTAQDIDEIAKRIKERGGTLASEPADMPWGARVFRVVDPDGFRMAISSAG